MKLTEGLFKRTFEELAAEYPEITPEHLIIDNVAHQMAKGPAQFDVVVTTNLNGDIISDLASGLVGGLGFAPSGNYGDDVAIFEAVHGSAPKYAGKDVINPTALVLSSLMMLRHLEESDAADRIEDAVLVTLEEGRSVTQDLARQTGGDVEQAASTTGFTDAIIANLGNQPSTVPPRRG
jgi:isocitrate dehydrogenase